MTLALMALEIDPNGPVALEMLAMLDELLQEHAPKVAIGAKPTSPRPNPRRRRMPGGKPPAEG